VALSVAYVCLQNHLFEVERGHVESRYVTEFHTKSSTRPGQRELRSRGFGPFVDKEDLVNHTPVEAVLHSHTVFFLFCVFFIQKLLLNSSDVLNLMVGHNMDVLSPFGLCPLSF